MNKNLLNQLRTNWQMLVILYIPLILILSYIQFLTPLPFDKLTRDWATIAKVKFYWGLLSNIGILMWWAAATVCLFTFSCLEKA